MANQRISNNAGLRPIFSLTIFCLFASIFAGCTGLGGPIEPTARLSADREEINAGDSVNFDARESSSPDGTIITGYTWDFGDGTSMDSLQGYTSHVFEQPGLYEIRVIATNDEGGEDSDTAMLFVNGYPEISISMPAKIRTGNSAVIDASSSFDFEGEDLTFSWIFNWISIDESASSEPLVEFVFNSSGNYSGSVTVTDERGASITKDWSLEVLPRTYQVIWQEIIVEAEWGDYLQQGESYSVTHIPGEAGRILSVNATLTLAMDILPTMLPQDNFTLTVNVRDDGWSSTARTEQENITKNSTASISREEINPSSESQNNLSADSLEQLMEMLVNQSGMRFGQGEWTWIIEAEQADPDFLIDEIDPDGGNDWELVVEFVVLVPRVSEVGV
ncbi:MAG: PKD domain-containing protein [Candidatus Thalassarchaeaceae archaeon]|nr:PKD domain-containing protein [Candidatus Thalassarchaeaceae archaeon]